MRLTLLAASAAVGLALSMAASMPAGAQAASLTLLGTPAVQNQSVAQTVDYREGRERCFRERRECAERFAPGSWRFRRCMRYHGC